MLAIIIFFVSHWLLAVFVQTFFQHRYSAHKMFTMSRFWEKFFHLMTLVVQGSSYLDPRGYGILHRMHHKYSDTPEDPHSPLHSKGFLAMMWETKQRYHDFAHDIEQPAPEFDGDLPRWKTVDMLGSSYTVRVLWGLAYGLFYIAFVPAGMWYLYLLLPVHWLMGPIHGAMVNWGGHMYGYRNHDLPDNSKNSLPIDFLIGGELYQNNHHGHPTSPNFAYKKFEFDWCYQVMRFLNMIKVIKIKRAVWTPDGREKLPEAA